MLRVLLAPCLLTIAVTADAATDCVFETSGTTMRLVANCRTDASIVIPDGMTLDGAQHTITAVDPPGGHFTGGIVVNGGRAASVVNTRLTVEALADVCDAGDERLRGILLSGASGLVRGNTVVGINQGASSCQEGNAIEVWNFSDTPVIVEIVSNTIANYQKSGVVVSGAVEATVRKNWLGPSAPQVSVPANAVQVGFGAWAAIEENDIEGSRWPLADAAATAILLSGSATATVVRGNNVTGSADVGIYIAAGGALVINNLLYDEEPDGFYDIGIVIAGEQNVVRNNEIRGYLRSYFWSTREPSPSTPARQVARR